MQGTFLFQVYQYKTLSFFMHVFNLFTSLIFYWSIVISFPWSISPELVVYFPFHYFDFTSISQDQEMRETNRIIICQVGITICPKIVLIAHESLTLENNTSLEDICIFVASSILHFYI